MPSIFFTIPGPPVAKARARATMVAGRARLYTPDKTSKYEARVAVFAQQAMRGVAVAECAVSLSVTAYFSTPASWSKKKIASKMGTAHTSKPDLDNIIKAIKDGANGIVWRDDSQVADLCECRKRYSDTDRVDVAVWWPDSANDLAQGD